MVIIYLPLEGNFYRTGTPVQVPQGTRIIKGILWAEDNDMVGVMVKQKLEWFPRDEIVLDKP